MTATVTITVLLKNPTEEHEVCAWLTPTPGLVVYESPRDPGWVVAHQRSGLCVGFMADPESAYAMATEFGALTDWTLSGEDLRRQEALGCKVWEIRRRKGSQRGRSLGNAIDRNVLA